MKRNEVKRNETCEGKAEFERGELDLYRIAEIRRIVTNGNGRE